MAKNTKFDGNLGVAGTVTTSTVKAKHVEATSINVAKNIKAETLTATSVKGTFTGDGAPIHVQRGKKKVTLQQLVQRVERLEIALGNFKFLSNKALTIQATGKWQSVKLIKAKDGFAVLSQVGGDFEGGGERVRVRIVKGYWILEGKSLQSQIYAVASIYRYPR